MIATESYEQFAENLQKEIEEDTGIRFGIVEAHQFAGDPGRRRRRQAARRWASSSRRRSGSTCKAPGYVDAKGKVQDSLQAGAQGRHADRARAVRGAARRRSREILRKLAGRLEIKNADERRQVRDPAGRAAQRGVQGAVGPHQAQDHLPRAVRQREAGRELHRALCGMRRPSPRRGCSGARPTSPSARPAWRRRSGEGAATVVLDEADIELPDLLTDLQDRTQLTRRSIQRILIEQRPAR